MSSTPNDSIFVVATIVGTVNEAITEYGVFDAAVGGDMCLHADIGEINLRPGDSIVFTTSLRFC